MRAASRDSAARDSRGAEGNRAGLLRLGSLPVSCGLLIDLWAFDPIGKSQGIPLYVYTWENTLYIYFCHQNLGYPGAAPDSRYIHLNGIFGAKMLAQTSKCIIVSLAMIKLLLGRSHLTNSLT